MSELLGKLHDSGRHRCPRKGCDETVSNRIFCCAKDWYLLPLAVREEIGRTARAPLASPQRRIAIARAMEAWSKL